MHEIDPDETTFERPEPAPEPATAASRDTMGPHDGTAADQSMDPDAMATPGRIAPDDLSAIPSDTQPVADDAAVRREGEGWPRQASDQSDAPIPDVMGAPGGVTPDVMGAPVPETDETLGDRNEAERP